MDRDRDSGGQAVQGVQGEEDVRLALEGARPVPQQLAALQVGGDVLHADGLQERNQKKMFWCQRSAKPNSLNLTPAAKGAKGPVVYYKFNVLVFTSD